MGIYFQVVCKLGKHIRITARQWEKITKDKHPVMSGREGDVEKALTEPDEIRRDLKNTSVYRYYKKFTKLYLRVVVKHLNDEGFLITAFPEQKMGGELVWQK